MMDKEKMYIRRAENDHIAQFSLAESRVQIGWRAHQIQSCIMQRINYVRVMQPINHIRTIQPINQV
jgi:hypothetical protein